MGFRDVLEVSGVTLSGPPPPPPPPANQLNDVKYAGLIALGAAPGAIDDMERQVLQTTLSLAVARTNNDMWYAVFQLSPSVTGGAWNDAAYAWLGAGGHLQGTLNERWFSYWSSQ